MLTAGYGNGAQLITRGAKFTHVTARNHAVTCRRSEPAINTVVAPGFFIRLTCSRSRVIGQADHGHFALPCFNGHRRIPNHADITGTALIPHTANARHDAQRLGKFLAVHHLELGGWKLDEQAIHHVFLNARIGQGFANSFHIHRQRAASWQLAKSGVADSSYDGMASHQITSSSMSC